MFKQLRLVKNLVKKLISFQNNKKLLRLSLDEETILAQTIHGYYLCVPSWNIDVGNVIVTHGYFEPATTNMVRSILHPGDTYINIGANFGYYACLGAQLVGNKGKVIAIEANPLVFIYLIKSLHWAGYTNVVDAFLCAAHEKKIEKVSLAYDPQYIGGGNLFSGSNKKNYKDCLWSADNVKELLDENNKYFVGRGFHTPIEVTANSVDNIISGYDNKKNIKLLHMDVEGAENFIIKGSKELIKNSPEMQIIMEWFPCRYKRDAVHYHKNREESGYEMWDFLIREHKFSVYRIVDGVLPRFGLKPDLEKLDSLEKIFNMSVEGADLYLKRE